MLLAAWLALFQFLGNAILGYVHTPSLFSWMLGQYNNPNADDGHGNFIPFLVIGLFWWKRRELLALPLKLWWPGLLILLAATDAARCGLSPSSNPIFPSPRCSPAFTG